MTIIRVDEHQYVQDNNPYLFESEDNFTRLAVEPLHDNKIELYAEFPRDVPSVVREDFARLAELHNSAFYRQRSQQQYQWDGRSFDLTPKQARKLAKALKKAAAQVESRD